MTIIIVLLVGLLAAQSVYYRRQISTLEHHMVTESITHAKEVTTYIGRLLAALRAAAQYIEHYDYDSSRKIDILDKIYSVLNKKGNK